MLHAKPPAAAPGSLQPVSGGSANGSGVADWPSEDQQCDQQGCWPRLFIIGTQKGATTSLFGALHQEGAVCGTVMSEAVARVVPSFADFFTAKEAHIFDLKDSMWDALVKQRWMYQSLYKLRDCPQRTFMDATPRYIRNPATPARLEELMPASWLPQLRVVLSIPFSPIVFVSRLFSITVRHFQCAICQIA